MSPGPTGNGVHCTGNLRGANEEPEQGKDLTRDSDSQAIPKPGPEEVGGGNGR